MRERAIRIIGVSMIVAGIVVGIVGVSLAGVIDSPLPTIDAGQDTLRMFIVPGVIKNNNIETVFICTSLANEPVTVAVEVFASTSGPPVNDVTALNGVQALSPGETRTITTGATAAFHEDQIMTLPAASLRNGSARILSTSKSISCIAFLTDQLSDPPISMNRLPMISKKQRGD